MRLISKFHDYYDSAAVWRDETLCYVREQKEWSEADMPRELHDSILEVNGVLRSMPRCSWAKAHVIAFCGKTYPCYVTDENETFYNPAQMEKAFKLKKPTEFQERDYWKKRIAELNRKEPRKWRSYSYGVPWWTYNELTYQSWQEFVDNKWFKFVDVEPFRLMKAPVFELYYEDRYKKYLVVNPSLRNRNFATQVDPYTAFQELSMYIGNDLVVQMDADIVRTDELIRDSKGMDEWSFRKMGKNSKRKK